MKKLLLILAVLCTVLSVSAQRFNSFSNDPSKTVEEMKSFLATVSKDRQKEANDMLDEFTAFWTTSIDYENQLAFIQEANALVRHKFRPIPQFQSYMHAYMAFVTGEYAAETETWVKMVEYHATHNVTQFQKNMLLYERSVKPPRFSFPMTSPNHSMLSDTQRGRRGQTELVLIQSSPVEKPCPP